MAKDTIMVLLENLPVGFAHIATDQATPLKFSIRSMVILPNL